MNISKTSIKWVALTGLTAFVIGCGGASGGSSTTGGGTTGGTGGGVGRSIPSINLGSTGFVSLTYLSGTSRRDVGSQIADFKKIELIDADNAVVPTADGYQASPVSVMLDSYSVNQRDIPVDLGGKASRAFTEYPFVVDKIREIDQNGASVDKTSGSPAFTSVQPFDVISRVFRGRYSNIQIRLSDAVLSFNAVGGGLIFDEDKFAELNYDQSTGVKAIKGYMGDYFAFDLSDMADADRPMLSDGSVADRLYFSGDGIAVSNGVGPSSLFELLDPILIKSGFTNLGGIVGGRRAPNTYTLQDTQLDAGGNPMSAQTSLNGIWREYSDVVSATTADVFLTIPSSSDNLRQQVIFLHKDNGKITAMWEGVVDYSATDSTTGTFKLFPVVTLTDAVPLPDVVNGTVSNFTTSGGAVMSGYWDVTGTAPASWTFSKSGGYAVVR